MRRDATALTSLLAEEFREFKADQAIELRKGSGKPIKRKEQSP